MKITVESKAGTSSFDCPAGETLLYAGLQHGLDLPYECATGTCGTCHARLMEGTADIAWEAAPGFARLKRDKGDILMCQARPRSDCVLRVPANVVDRSEIGSSRCSRRGTLQGLRRLTHDVIHFDVLLSAPMTFEAGQFVVIEVPGLEGGRAYSMVNFEQGTDRVGFVVKRKPGGAFGNWLFDGEAEGATVKIFGPLGRATFLVEDNKDVLCIAGGSGVAGMMSILDRATSADYFRDRRGYLFFGVRTLTDAFYLEELARHVAAAGDRLEVTLALSHEDVSTPRHAHFPGLRLANGMVHEVAARQMAGRYGDVISYIAGPTPMVDATLRTLIVEAGLTGSSIRYDKFS